jgi:acyl transferase domain-containing protein/surfactin synthase thioesterase subunit/NADPH-dependent curcumin reductase CurA/NADP-dependent 3-hydroxy acid dehydrogenase YdfG
MSQEELFLIHHPFSKRFPLRHLLSRHVLGATTPNTSKKLSLTSHLRLGGIGSPHELWDALTDGTDLVSEVPHDRFNINNFYDSDTSKTGAVKNRYGGFVDKILSFDAEFFGLFPAHAARIDPQQRLTLEATYHALEDAGVPIENVAGTRTSVFMGAFMYDHLCTQTATLQRDNISPHVAMGASTSGIANRVSHQFDLRGPSVTLDTACSGSLVALHLACQSIWTGEADGAVAGGVNAILRPESSIMMSKAGFLSPDGRCKSFDASANGYVRSEGVGVVYLKRFSKAVADGDRIYAVVRGSAVNQDGYTPEGIMVPSVGAQVSMLNDAYKCAGISPSTVRYVETHGPGTPVGDPVEAAALGEVLGPGRQEPLWIGSLKGNIGHLEGASGIAGFIKAALVTYHGQVPAQLHHHNPNPAIPFARLGLGVPIKNTPLVSGSEPLYIGVNSFGAGGTNAHVVLERRKGEVVKVQKLRPAPVTLALPRVFVLSARAEKALQGMALALTSYLRTSCVDLNDLAYTLSARRSRLSHAWVIAADSHDALCDCLGALARGDAPRGSFTLHRSLSDRPRIAFAFSGQGGQWLGMGQKLAEREPIFDSALKAFDKLFEARAHFSILEEIARAPTDARLNDTKVVQPAIAGIQIALARLLISYGVVPDAIVGHSIGEVAAAHIAGALTLEEAVAIIHLRSDIQSKAAGCGAMLAVGLSAAEAEQLIQPVDGRVEISTYNGPRQLTLAGDRQSLEELANSLQADSIFARFVQVEVPYHSRFMDSLESDIIEAMSPIQGHRARIPLYSTVSTECCPGTHLTGSYWFENIRKPVRYTETVARMIEDGYDFFIEIGPHPVLLSGTSGTATEANKPVLVLPSMRREQEAETLAILLGAAHAATVAAVDLNSFNGGNGSLVHLPPYAFQRQHHWFEIPNTKRRRVEGSVHPLIDDITRLSDDNRGMFTLRLSTGANPFLTDHQVDGAIVFPASGHIEAAYAAATNLTPHQNAVIEDLRIEHPIVLTDPEGVAPQTLLEVTTGTGDYTICYRAADASPESTWQPSSRGRINTLDSFPALTAENLESVRERLQRADSVDVPAFYTYLERAGLRYGDAFRCVRLLWRHGMELFGRVELPMACQTEANRFHLHPALLDACLHIAFAEQHHRGDPNYAFLPNSIERVQIACSKGITAAWAHVQITRHDSNFLCFDACVYDDNGNVIAKIKELTTKRVAGTQAQAAREYEVCFKPAPHNEGQLSNSFAHVALLGSADQHAFLAAVVTNAFPKAQIHRAQPGITLEKLLSSVPLDRRTLIVLPTYTPAATKLRDTLDPPVTHLLDLARWLHGTRAVPWVVVITQRACIVSDDSGCDPAAAGLEAAVRVLANELPQVPFRVIDIPVITQECSTELLVRELRYNSIEGSDTVVALRHTGRFARRILPIDSKDTESRSTVSLPACGGAYVCSSDMSGSLDGLSIRRQAPRILQSNEVSIEVHAAGVNFKDVMNAIGLLAERTVSGSLAGQRLGLEIAGRVLATGIDVKDLAPGDTVMARVANGFAGRVVASRDLIAPMPETLTFAEAACVPVVYVTAYYALSHLARLEPGEIVLVQSGAGGVGIAAIQLAKRLGARVLATAGTLQRREMLLSLGVEAAFDSRSPDFHDEIMKLTTGRGVDVVLNSLTGQLLLQGIACLAPFGRFVEIGKTDIYRNARLGLERLGDNCSFSVVDVDRLASQQPKRHRQILDKVADMFVRGELTPHPVAEYPITNVPSALNTLSRGAVFGKLAITMPAGKDVVAFPPAKLLLHAGRTYLITGGASGFGLEVARLFATRGAQHLVLVSRSGPKTAEDRQTIRMLEQSGVSLHLEQADVADETSVLALMNRLQHFPPLAGVLHSAGVIDDALAHETTQARFWGVFAPKALGAWHLHQVTQHMQLDFFVMVSSCSSVLGLLGQFSYAAANQFLDSLAHQRQASGKHGLSVNLGVLGDYAGMSRSSADTDKVLNVLASHGLSRMALPDILEGLERSMLQDVPQRMITDIDWQQFFNAYPHLLHDGAFRDARHINKGSTGAQAAACFRTQAEALPLEERIDFVADQLRLALAKIVGAEPDRISTTEKIDRYSLDSMTLTQVRSIILREMQTSYPLMRLMQGPTLRDIAVESLGSDQEQDDSAQNTLGTAVQNNLSPGLKTVSPWLVRPSRTETDQMRLVCFPSLGVGASLFTPFLVDSSICFEPFALQTPGHETRRSEPVPTSLSELVAGIVAAMLPLVDRPCIFWGHGFGGIVAFEVLRALQRADKPLPRHLVVTGTIAPHLIHIWQHRDVLLRFMAEDWSPEYLMAVSRQIDSPEFVRSILPGIRLDMPLLLGYNYEAEPRVDIPITAFAARQDEFVYPDEVDAWRELATDFRLVEVDGDHWFLNRNHELLRSTLAALAAQ